MKNNKIAIICAGILAASSQLLAISNDELLKRLEQLESEVGGLKKSIKGEMQKEIGSIENRMDSIETSVLLNKINWGLGLKNRVDFYDTKKVDGSKSHSGNVWATKLHLNMDSQITDDMKFTGRLAMYKYWSGNTAIGNANQMAMYDPMQGRTPADSSIFAERAYLDYTLNKDSLVPVTITLGRQPSSDGPSHQFKDNTVRKSTYSALGFDGAADGIVATADFEKATGIENAAVRLAYGKGYQAYNTSGSMSQYVDRNTDVKDALFYAMFIDGAIPALKGSLLQFGYVKAMDVTGMTGGANLGSIDLFGLMAEFTNIADTGLDLFAHYGISKTRSNGSFVNVNGVNYGLLSSQPMGDLGVDRTGNAFWVGGRYALPFSFKGKIGYEYNRGSQYWTSFTSAANDLTNKLAVRGNAHEVYYIQPLNRYAHLRAGAQFIKYDYAGSGFHLGTPMKLGDAGTAREIENLANYYIMFNLLF